MSTITNFIPWTVLVCNILSLILLLALIFRKTWGKSLVSWVGEHALALGLLISGGAVVGSLFYSNVVGFEPCSLCWWQRIVIYPVFVLFVVAILKRDREVFKYVFPLGILGFIFASYHSYVQWGGSPLIPCDITASCAKLYVFALGYVTIPTMSLSVVAVFLLLVWANKVYQTSR